MKHCERSCVQWQKNIKNMMNNINSTPRKSLNWKSPYEVASEMFREEFLKKLNISKIESKDIILNSKLFKKDKYIVL